MKDNRTDNKLNTKLVPGEISQTCTKKFKLKFTDYAIEKYLSSFIDPKTNKTRYRVYTNFDVPKKSILKGLKLCQFEESKSKWFVLNYWYQKKSYFVDRGSLIWDFLSNGLCRPGVLLLDYKVCPHIV